LPTTARPPVSAIPNPIRIGSAALAEAAPASANTTAQAHAKRAQLPRDIPFPPPRRSLMAASGDANAATAVPPMAGLAVRLATPEEAPLIATLVTEAFAEYRGRLVPESGALSETPATVAAWLAAGYGALAEAGGEAVGAALFRREPGLLYLGRLAVPPQHRRRGVAAALLGFIEAEARRTGFGALALGVRIALPENRRLFEAHGFREIARLAHPGFVEPTSVRMIKPLA